MFFVIKLVCTVLFVFVLVRIICYLFIVFFSGLSSPILTDSQFSDLNRSLTGRFIGSMEDDLRDLDVEEIDFFSVHDKVCLNFSIFECFDVYSVQFIS